MGLRPYQREACAASFAAVQTEHTLLESPTGTGKTEMAIAISEKAVEKTAGPVLVVAPTDEIYGQMIARYQRAGWMVHADKAERRAQPARAIEQALDGAKVVVVASLGTVAIRDRIERYPRAGWALPILDECFPAGTLVDGRPIESIRVGDHVRSYNHETNSVETRPVVRTFASRPIALVTVHLSTGQRITCTAGHPFFVGGRYRPAVDLQTGDLLHAKTDVRATMRPLLNAVHDTERHSDTDMLNAVSQGKARRQAQTSSGAALRELRCSNGDHRQMAGSSRPQHRTGLLLRHLPGHVCGASKFHADGANQPQVCKCANEGSQPNEATRGACETVKHPPSYGPWTAGPRRQRTWADSHGDKVVCDAPAGMEVECCGPYQHAARHWLSDSLQVGHGAPRLEGRRRGGRSEPPGPCATGPGRQEDSVSPVAWVDRVEVHERQGEDGFGALCPGDRVYNIEVAGNHNYFADGILVHNCHHAPAATWQGVRQYFEQPWLGLSATPERKGMAKLWTRHVRAFKRGLAEAIEQGWLVPFTHQYALGMSQKDYERLKDEDPAEVGKALPAAIATLQEALGARQGIAFWPRTLAAKQAAKFLRSLPEEISARALVGAMPREERTLALRQYVAGTLRVLNLCQVGVEGLDVPPAAVLAIYQQTKIRARVAQMVGRVLRPDASCLAGLEEALPEERRWAIERSSKPSAFVLSIAPPDAVDGWETPGALLWGHLPEPVLIDIDRRQRQGKDLETARREALAAEEDRAKEREAKRLEYEARLAAAAPARAQAVADARPYELRDPAEVARDTRRKRLVEAWRRWRNRANAEVLTMHRMNESERKERLATSAQASAIAKLVAEYLREPSPRDGHGRVGAEVLTWDRQTAIKAQHALRMMCGHGVRQKQRAG